MKYRRFTQPFIFCLAATLSVAVAEAREIHRWTDEDGVVHFSDEAPPADAREAQRITLDEPRNPGQAADDDPFNIDATAERMQAYREEMASRREAQRAERLERERLAAQRPVVQYQNVGRAYTPWYLRPPLYPVQPIQPPAPVPEPYPTAPFRPPGGWQD